MVSNLQLVTLAVLFSAFLGVPTISKMLGSTLDLLPIRIAAVLLILASVQYDRLISLAVFLVIAGLYIHHHNNDLRSVLSNESNANIFSNDDSQIPAISVLPKGGHAEEVHDMMDFMPKQGVQDNEVDPRNSNSIDTKHVLPTEPLGSNKAQNLFGEDSRNAHNLEQWSNDGSR